MTDYEPVGVVHYGAKIIPGPDGGVQHWQNSPHGWTVTEYTRAEWLEALEDD